MHWSEACSFQTPELTIALCLFNSRRLAAFPSTFSFNVPFSTTQCYLCSSVYISGQQIKVEAARLSLLKAFPALVLLFLVCLKADSLLGFSHS